MKKIFLYFVTLAAAVACYPVEVESDLSTMITETISGTYGPSTKATISDADASFKWSVGDNIAVHVSNGDSHMYVFTSDQGGAGASDAAVEAAFTVSYEPGYSRDAFAVYPDTIVARNAVHYGQSGDTLDVKLPGSYTLAQVQGEVSPCPMIATNAAGSGWEFYQLCSLLRLTVNYIPSSAKRLEIDFDGKKVCGDFSIAAPITPGTSVISTTNDAVHDIITITKDGSDVVLGSTSLVVNVPLPVGDYSKITINAYDAISGGNVVSFNNISFSYTADNTKGVKKTTSLTDQSVFTFTFRDADTQTNLSGLRFVRLFSCQNKLYNGSTTFGPYTVSSATGEADMANPVQATLKFGSDDGDQLAFQVIDANGKVYSGLYNAPTGGFQMGAYDLTVDVKAYTFTVADGKKVYFSPGDLGVDNSVYSFTEPFVTWGWGGNTTTTKRVWFNYTEVNYRDITTGHEIYGIKWRNPKSLSTTTTPHEWDNIIGRTNMNTGVNAYYKVSASNLTYCLLLPPDETVLTDEEKAELEGGSVGNNYAKYLGKGFVLLIKTGRALYSTKLSWGMTSQGWYWALWDNMGNNRTYFYWKEDTTIPTVSWAGNQFRMRVRYVRDVN